MKKEKATVLLVSVGFAYGGAETYYVKLAKILLTNFSVIAVVCCPRLRDEFQALGIEVTYVSPNGNRYFETVKACRQMVKRYKPELGHCNGQPESYLAPFLWLMGMRVLTTRHTPFSTLYMQEGARMPAYIKRSIVLFCLAFTRKTICVSQLLKRQMSEYISPAELVFIPTWVEDHLLAPYDRPQPTTTLQALFLGRVVRNKGIFDVIEAIRRCDNVHVTVVGEGDQMQEAQTLAQGLPITFAGFSRDTPAAYRAADLLIFASPEGFEGLPQVPLEALAMSLPCLASDISSVLEIAEVPPGQPPVLALYKQGNVDDLVVQLKALAADHARLTQLSIAGRRQVEERFTVAAVQHVYVQVFEDSISERGLAQ